MNSRNFLTLRLPLLAGLSLALGLAAVPALASHESKKTGFEADIGVALLMPIMNPERGRKLFASKGCVVCHSIHGVGGTDAPSLDFSHMEKPVMNPFDFVARMWRGAPVMIAMQRNELGHQIEFTGQELADIIAFAHDRAEQQKFTVKDIPPRIRKIMAKD